MAKVGRPLTIPTPEEFEKIAQAYFDECDSKEQPYLITGLALALGFHSRKQMGEYEQREEYRNVVKRCRMIVESNYESRLFGNSPTGAIFGLKNMDWSDKQEVEHSGSVNITATAIDERL